MSTTNTQRYRSGPVSEVRGRNKAADTNHIGDIMGQSGNYSRTFDTLAASTAGFANEFLGVLQQGATLGSETADSDNLIYSDGEFEHPLDQPADKEYPVGSLVSAVGSQTVSVYGATVTEAVGTVARRVQAGDTTVLWRARSAVMGNAVHQNPSLT